MRYPRYDRSMGNTVERQIEAVAWMERSLENSISTVYIDDKKIIGGDWNGTMVCWSRDGDVCWETDVGDRVSGIRLSKDEKMLWCIAGREAIGIDYENGAVKWKIEFDGSTDLIELDGEHRAWVVSSVYDIELNDFMESAISLIDSGIIIEKHILDERPWSIHPVREGQAFFGLGRPRAGLLELTEEKGKFTVSHKTVHDSPVLCGSNVSPFFVGHSNGMITQINDNYELNNLELSKENDSPIIDLASSDEHIFLFLEDKEILCVDMKGEVTDSVKISESEGESEFLNLIDGVSTDGYANFWTITSTMNGAFLIDTNRNIGTSKIKLKIIVNSRIRDIANADGMTVVGLDDGRVISIEENMLKRRIENEEQPIDEREGRRLDMRERLRKLRE